MTQWLTIVGVGEDGFEGLSAAGKLAVGQADLVIGSDRLFRLLPKLKARLEAWPQPFSKIVDQVSGFRTNQTVLLATGDPLNYGVARKVLEFVPKDEVKIIPHLSAFSLAASILGWSLPDCDCFTIHGRPSNTMEIFIQPDARLLVLTEDETSVAEVCRRLVERGFSKSSITVLENLGGPRQRVINLTADQKPELEWSPLNTLAIHCIADAHAKIWSRLAGLPDEAFENDGQMTKREIRAMTLAALAPAPDQVLWDIGAGCGSIAIEWIRSTRGAMAYAVEPVPDRQTMISKNAEHLGAPRLFIFNGKAPEAYDGLPPPNAVFIGGGINDEGVFEGAWGKLMSSGNLVANTVTLEGDARLIELQKQYGGELVRMDVSTLINVGELRALRPRMSVLQWRVRKS